MATRRHSRMHKHKHTKKCKHCVRKCRTNKMVCGKCLRKGTHKHHRGRRRMRGG